MQLGEVEQGNFGHGLRCDIEVRQRGGELSGRLPKGACVPGLVGRTEAPSPSIDTVACRPEVMCELCARNTHPVGRPLQQRCRPRMDSGAIAAGKCSGGDAHEWLAAKPPEAVLLGNDAHS